VLHNITLTIKRGGQTALVGGSGAGKTTLADLLHDFTDPTQYFSSMGLICEINTLRRRLAVVSQDTFIFNTSAENIACAMKGR